MQGRLKTACREDRQPSMLQRQVGRAWHLQIHDRASPLLQCHSLYACPAISIRGCGSMEFREDLNVHPARRKPLRTEKQTRYFESRQDMPII
jgi:hypothetical protein